MEIALSVPRPVPPVQMVPHHVPLVNRHSVLYPQMALVSSATFPTVSLAIPQIQLFAILVPLSTLLLITPALSFALPTAKHAQAQLPAPPATITTTSTPTLPALSAPLLPLSHFASLAIPQHPASAPPAQADSMPIPMALVLPVPATAQSATHRLGAIPWPLSSPTAMSWYRSTPPPIIWLTVTPAAGNAVLAIPPFV